jgi:hypothetical protein
LENNSELVPSESTICELPYNSLSWEIFERLCRDLTSAYFSELINVRLHLGRGHSQDGIDISGFDPNDGKYVHVQAKNYVKFTVSDLEKAVEKFEEGEHFEDCKIFVLAVSTANIDRAYEQELKKVLKRFKSSEKQFVLWDSAGLDLILNKFPQIVFDTFDKGDIDRPFYIKAFNGTAAFQKLIVRPKRKLYECPEHYVSRLLSYEDQSVIKKQSLIDAIESSSNNILLKSAATIGKTIELEYLAYHYSGEETNSYFPILISLKNYVNQSIEELLKVNFNERWKQISPTQLLVILDGFDEVKAKERDTFLRHLDNFKTNNSLVRIVLSSRTNFITGSTILEDFKDYTLSEFGADEVQLYVSKTLNPEHYQPFLKIIQQRNIKQWINSPYNLANFIELFKRNPDKLPQTRTELISSILETHYQKDFKKSRADVIQQSERRGIIQKLAFSYSLYGVNSVSLDELLRIFDNKEVEIIQGTSFIKFSESIITFNHNILQECLTANLLSSKTFNEIVEIICFKPDYMKIKPKWFNTITLLIDVLSNTAKGREVVKFVCEKEHTLLEEVEYAFFSTNVKREIFVSLMTNSDRIYGRFMYENTVAEICSLNEDEYILEYLLDILSNDDGNNLGIFLRILMELDGVITSEYENEIIEILVSILNNKEFNDETKSLTYQVLTRLKIVSENLINISEDFLKSSTNCEFADSIIGYLNICPNHEGFINVYLKVLTDWHLEHIGGITPNIFTGILQFKKPESLSTILDFLKENQYKLFDYGHVLTRNYYEQEGFFESFANNLSEAYQRDNSLFEKVLEFVVEVNYNGEENQIKNLLNFFFQTRTLNKAFWKLWSNYSTNNFRYRYTAALLIDIDILQTFISQFRKAEVLHNEIWNIIHGLNHAGKTELAENFRVEVNKISNNYFQYRVEVNRQEIYKSRLKRDVELLTNKGEFIDSVESIFSWVGESQLTQENLSAYKEEWDVCDNNIVPKVLRKYFKLSPKIERVNKDDFLKWVFENEELYVHNVVRELNTFGKEHFNAKSKKYLQTWYEEIEPTIDFECQIQITSNGFGIKDYDSILIGNFFQKKLIELNANKQLELLFLDLNAHLWLQDRNDKESQTITEKVISLQGEHAVKKQLLKNLKSEIVSIVVIENHVKWCERLKVKESLPLIVEIVRKFVESERHSMYSIVKSYFKLGGNTRSFKFIFEQFNPTIDFHWLVLQKMAEVGAFKRQLKGTLFEKVDSNNANEYLFKASNILIKIRAIEGLLWFVKWYELQPFLPDSWFSPNLEEFDFQEVYSTLYKLLKFVVGEKLNSTRGSNPIREILKSLKPLAFKNEESFIKCLVDFTLLANSNDVIEQNIYILKSSIYNFESEYYLERQEFDKFSDVSTLLT